MADLEHKNITDPNLHEPKGAATAALGQVYVADGAGSGSWQTLSRGTVVGFADYNDTATASTPINLVANTPAYLTNDGAGTFTNTAYLPSGISSSIWDSAVNKFDWAGAGLQLGDMVDIRLDLLVTTTSANQTVEVSLELDTDGAPYQIPFAKAIVKTAGANEVNRYNGVYMGNLATLNGKARFKIVSDATATVVVRGWYVKVLINR